MKTATQSRNWLIPACLLMAAAALAAVAPAYAQAPFPPGQGQPPFPPGQAGKVVVSATSLELIEAHVTEEGVVSEPVELLHTSLDIQTGAASDLTVRIDGECAAWVNAGEPDEGTGPVTASVITWVEVNGEPIVIPPGPVDEPATVADGSVVMCNSSQTLELSMLELEEIIDEFEESRVANGFGWTVPEIGRGPHELTVMAAIEFHAAEEGDDNGNGEVGPEQELGDAEAVAVVGKRIAIIEPARVEIDTTPPPIEDPGL